MTHDDQVVLSARGLSKRYKQVQAVSDVSFEVRRGRIVGFLGPNGAGKTTTLRMLLGLVRPTSGIAHVLGVPYRRLGRPLQRVGVSLEGDGFVPGRTGRNHLRSYAGLAGCDEQRITGLLETVGMVEAADRAVGDYSTGMKRRLSLATALLGDPEVLILDEPANGLDPEGMIWLRGLLRYWADQGASVLLSSHLLDEMQKIVDDVLLIHRGRVLRTGTLEDFVSAQACVVRSAAGSEEAVAAALTDRGWQSIPLGDGRLWVQAAAAEVRAAVGQGPGAGTALVEDCSLEAEFLRLIRSGGEVIADAEMEGSTR